MKLPPAQRAGARESPASLREGLTSRPAAYLRSPWPWRALTWGLQACVAGWVIIGLWAAVIVPPRSGAWSLATPGGIALELLMVALLVAGSMVVALWQRRAVRMVGAPRVVPGYPMRTRGMQPWAPAVRQVAAGLVRHGAVGRDVAYAALLTPLAAVLLAVTYLLPFWIAAVAVTAWQSAAGPIIDRAGWSLWLAVAGVVIGTLAAPWLWGWLAQAGCWLAHAIMDPGKDNARTRSAELSASRRRLAQAFAAERRRIERDLHDGVQQRIVAQAMTLGMAQLALDEVLTAHELAQIPAARASTRRPDPAPVDTPAEGKLRRREVTDTPAEGELRRREVAHTVADAAALVAQAKAENAAILRDLRELVRSISPQVLRDEGLAAALEEVAGYAALPVDCRVDLPVRPDELTESTAYFVVLEALTNAAKYAQAGLAQVRVVPRAGGVEVSVRDNGRGGARFTPGGGLAGLVERVESAGGRLEVSSPPGGPTVVRAKLPGQVPAADAEAGVALAGRDPVNEAETQ